MRNIDVMTTVLSEVTNQSPEHLESVIMGVVGAGGIKRTQLLVELDDDEATELLTKLRSERGGILRWIVEGAVMAHSKAAMG